MEVLMMFGKASKYSQKSAKQNKLSESLANQFTAPHKLERKNAIPVREVCNTALEFAFSLGIVYQRGTWGQIP